MPWSVVDQVEGLLPSKSIRQDFTEEVEFQVGLKNGLYFKIENILSKEIRIQTHL